MSSRFLRLLAVTADRFLNWKWPMDAAAEFAQAAFLEFEADRDVLEPGELYDLPAGAAVAQPPRAPLAAAPAGLPTDFDDLGTLQVKATVTDDDIEWWTDYAYLEDLVKDIFNQANGNRFYPNPLPAQPETPDFFKDAL